MLFDPTEQSEIALCTLAQLTQAGAWQLELAHARGHHLLIWVTRGQGLALLDGTRRGLGVHNALFIPAHHLMAIRLGQRGFATALVIPGDAALSLPQMPRHLRIREVAAQSELTVLMEALGREQNDRRPLCQGAMLAYAELVAIWLHRQLARQTRQTAAPDTAARRLSQAWCARLARGFTNCTSMAEHAAALGVTPTHLSRVSRAQTGQTAARLLSERQLHAARRLLIETNVPLQDIARHLRFGSAAYFTRFIRQHTGSTPSVLRSERKATMSPLVR